MIYSIFDDGNLVVSFDADGEAQDALQRLAADPEAGPHLVLVAFDATGDAVATAIPGERLVIPA